VTKKQLDKEKENMTWEEYRDLVLSAREKYEAVRDKADRKYDKMRFAIGERYKKKSKLNKYVADLEYFHAMYPAVMENVKIKDAAWEECKTKHKQATERYKRCNPESTVFFTLR